MKKEVITSNSQIKEKVDLNNYQLQPEAIRLIPLSVAVKHTLIPLTIEAGTLLVAMADVHNMLAIQEMAAICKKRIVPVAADPEQIRHAIDYNYTSYSEVEQQLNKVAASQTAVKKPTEETTQDISDAPIVRALELILNESVKARASDIHIEPQANFLRVRYRIDGVLKETMSLPLSAHSAIISRLKVMAKMNIADHRPQDGQLSFTVDDKGTNYVMDVRVATINTIYGEMATLRVLNKSFAARALQDLGFSDSTLKKLESMLKSPLGMVLLCGPTGSGKTTTLYASINSLDCKSRKVVTIEDPVEYRFPDIVQIQVNPKADITFATAVRSFMRHDPNVILIGEIRDPDTASMATQASLTGQLVLSSVHSNDAAGSITRLLDLGIGPFLISTTLLCVVAQRMARRVCPHCAQPAKESAEATLAYFNEVGEARNEFLVGKGCNACSQTGYLGRVVISEIMIINQELRAAISSGASADEIRDIAINSGMITMWRDGMLKAKEGITTPSEVLRNILYTG